MKDTTDFIKTVENVNNITDDRYLASLDVQSLYTGIPHTEGIEALRKSFQKSKLSFSICIIITFLRLGLTLNNFLFNGANFLQRNDCVMGTKCTPS